MRGLVVKSRTTDEGRGVRRPGESPGYIAGFMGLIDAGTCRAFLAGFNYHICRVVLR